MSTTAITPPRRSRRALTGASRERFHALISDAREHEVAEMLACRAAGRARLGEAGRSALLERELGVEAGRRSIADIDRALARLEAGTYGDCDECGAAIAPERLTALPQTRSCGQCRPRPVGFWGETPPSR
jgi:hypothetical protein